MKKKISISLDLEVLNKIDKIAKQQSIITKKDPSRSAVINFVFRSKFSLKEYIEYLRAVARDQQKIFVRALDMLRTAEEELEMQLDPEQRKLIEDPKPKISAKKSPRS